MTLAVFLRGKCPAKDVAPYWIAQVLAAVAAALVATFLCEKSGTPMVIKNVPAALIAEFLFTFALAYVVLNAITAVIDPMRRLGRADHQSKPREQFPLGGLADGIGLKHLRRRFRVDTQGLDGV